MSGGRIVWLRTGHCAHDPHRPHEDDEEVTGQHSHSDEPGVRTGLQSSKITVLARPRGVNLIIMGGSDAALIHPNSALQEQEESFASAAREPEDPTTIKKTLKWDYASQYEIELGIINKDPRVIDPIKEQCHRIPAKVRKKTELFNKDDSFANVVQDSRNLDFYMVRERLLDCLGAIAMEAADRTEMAMRWNISEPHTIFDGL